MSEFNVHEAKARLSELVERAAKGEAIVICRRNRPVAELRPLARRPNRPRPEAVLRGTVQIDPGFFEPLPGWLLDAFESAGSADEVPEPRPR
jgi:prevent-host-death family protein